MSMFFKHDAHHKALLLLFSYSVSSIMVFLTGISMHVCPSVVHVCVCVSVKTSFFHVFRSNSLKLHRNYLIRKLRVYVMHILSKMLLWRHNGYFEIVRYMCYYLLCHSVYFNVLINIVHQKMSHEFNLAH